MAMQEKGNKKAKGITISRKNERVFPAGVGSIERQAGLASTGQPCQGRLV
jgi:hypothetical protein